MAVKVPGWKAQVTALTATWPPKRMVKSLVASKLMCSLFHFSWTGANDVVVGAGLLQCRRRVHVPQPHVLVGAIGIGVAARRVGSPRDRVRIVARCIASRRGARCRAAGCYGGRPLRAGAVHGRDRP